MIAFFSSDEYFKLFFEKLKKDSLKVDLLITEPPKKAGRGLKTKENPAYSFAKKHNILILAPTEFDLSFKKNLEKIMSERKIRLGIIFSYGKIIPFDLIKLFKKGIINIHPSLLPKYRGSTPIQSAIINQDKVTGFSIIKLDEGCDSGDILYQQKITLNGDENYSLLKEKIINLAAKKLPDLVKRYVLNKIIPVIQNKKLVTYSRKLNKSDGLIKNSDSAHTALRKILAFNEYPKAYFEIDGKKIFVIEAKLKNNQLYIEKIQVEGKNIIDFSQFKNGYKNLLTKFPPYVSI